MYDIEFDITARDIVLTAPLFSGVEDFATTNNPSAQNLGNLLFSRCSNTTWPMVGIGMEEVIGSDLTKTAYEMNRWKAQAILDGATVAKWTALTVPPNTVDVLVEGSYL